MTGLELPAATEVSGTNRQQQARGLPWAGAMAAERDALGAMRGSAGSFGDLISDDDSYMDDSNWDQVCAEVLAHIL